MAHHRIAHPTDIPGCFGCRTLGFGFQGLRSRLGPDPVERTPVIGQQGPAGGTVVGAQHEHWDGRRDAVVKAPTIVVRNEECR